VRTPRTSEVTASAESSEFVDLAWCFLAGRKEGKKAWQQQEFKYFPRWFVVRA
jgi:hypothetical protein